MKVLDGREELKCLQALQWETWAWLNPGVQIISSGIDLSQSLDISALLSVSEFLQQWQDGCQSMSVLHVPERVCFFPKRRSRIPGFLVMVLSLGQVTWFTIWATREAPRRLLVSPQNDWWLRLQRICLQCRRLGFNPWVGKIPWRRERLPTPIFLLGELHGERSLAGYSSWGLKEWDMTERQTHIQNLCSFMRNTISSAKCFISFLHLSCGNPHFFQAT